MYAKRHWLWVLTCAWAITAWEHPRTTSGGIGKSRPVRRRWALLVGVTYQGLENDGYPVLPNAANDAKALARYLKKYYEGYTDATVFVLTDEKGSDPNRWPTREKIRSAIADLEKKAGKLDSVLIFLAGHAAPLGNGGLAFLPRDYKVRDDGRGLVSNSLLDLKSFPAREFSFPCHQKLLILDCCYAGQVFEVDDWKVGAKVIAESPYSDDPYFAQRPAFQVIVSARATQRASDGTGVNSKFTSQFLKALTMIGAVRAGSRQPYVRAKELADYVRRRLSYDDEQRPDCRRIQGEGEFVFFPKREEGLFDDVRIPEERQIELLAAVASQQGYWWFEEMPWCIPSIRSTVFERIVQEQKAVPSRGRYSLWASFDPKQIRGAVETVLREADAAKNEGIQNKDDRIEQLWHMRFAHARALLDAQGTGRMSEVCRKIENDLTEWKDSPETAPLLSAEDLHLLAVVRHALRQANGRDAYEDALERYERASTTRPAEPDEEAGASPARMSVRRIQQAIPQALCYADFGEYFREIMNDPKEAVARYRKALASVAEIDPSLKVPACLLPGDRLAAARSDTANRSADKEKKDSRPSKLSKVALELKRTEAAAKLFSVFVLSRMADAHLRLGHWDDAEAELACALDYVQEVAPMHYLEAHVYRRRAWAEIIRWQMAKAHRSFARSNEILDWLFEREREFRLGQAMEDRPKTSAEPRAGQFEPLTKAFHFSKNYAAKLAYLHNRHGMAMAQRFLGHSAKAASLYRQLSGEVEHTMSQFRRTATDRALERHYVIRIINTLERLGDCNLFGMPDQRQLSEAYDDYRRALQRVHVLRQWESEDVPYRASDRWRATLLYKQALALSLPSDIQDTELARELCEEADSIYRDHMKQATGLWQALGTLVTPVVRLLHEAPNGRSTKQAAPEGAIEGSAVSSQVKAADDLRKVIIRYRDVIGLKPHRDQLELCLFASKVLLEHGGARSPYQSQFDAELLHSFCRLTLASDSHEALRGVDAYEAQAYIRPYYDAVFRARWRQSEGKGLVVKELLELQTEAVTGRLHQKQPRLQPILAMYYLASEDECVLLWDDHRAPGACVPLSHYCDLNDVYSVLTRRRAGLVLASLNAGPAESAEMPRSVDQASLPLPRLIRDRIEALVNRPEAQAPAAVEVVWRGDSRFLARTIESHQRQVLLKPVIPQPTHRAGPLMDFPFELPRGVHIVSDPVK